MIKKKKDKKSYGWLKDKLDEVFSLYIRQRDKGVCFTCEAKNYWQSTDAGHWINRKHLATRWDERNVNAQCIGCNRFRGGNKEDYSVHLEKKFGVGILQELILARDKGKNKYTTSELEKLIEHYKQQIEKLK